MADPFLESDVGVVAPWRHATRRRFCFALCAAASLLAAAMSAYPALARAEVGEEPQVLVQSATAVQRTKATLNAVVDPNGSDVTECEFEYATSPQALEKEEGFAPVACSPSPGSGENLVSVAAEVTELKVSTTYYYRVVAGNEFGVAESGIAHFTTLPTAPKVLIETAQSAGRTSATLRGTVDPADSNVEECYFQVATSPAYESPIKVSCTSSPGSGESPVSVIGQATGLAESTLYYYRLVAKNEFGTTISAASASFTTLPTKPEVKTDTPTDIARTSATFNATVHPEGASTTCEFEYGTNTSVEDKVPCSEPLGSSEGSVQVSLPMSDLAEGTVYYFRVVATNSEGTTVGSRVKFSTLPTQPAVTTEPITKRTPNSVQLNATINPDGKEVTTCEFEWGTSAAYGNRIPCSSLPGSGEHLVAVSAELSGLAANSTYDYRIVAFNGLGGLGIGLNVKFTTPENAAPPIFQKLEEKKGPSAGGTYVSIVGSGFEEATAVTFGTVEATSIEVVSATRIVAVTPAEPAGTVQVTVTTPFGTTKTSSSSAFKFHGVVVASVSPNHGPTAGGITITITGSGFALGASETVFHFGAAAASSVDCTTSSECTAVTPPGTAGSVNILATANHFTSKREAGDVYTYT